VIKHTGYGISNDVAFCVYLDFSVSILLWQESCQFYLADGSNISVPAVGCMNSLFYFVNALLVSRRAALASRSGLFLVE